MAQFKPAEDFKLRDSAIRSAKRIHGANWKETHEVVAVGDRFVVKSLKAEEPKAVAPAPVIEEVKPAVAVAPVVAETKPAKAPTKPAAKAKAEPKAAAPVQVEAAPAKAEPKPTAKKPGQVDTLVALQKATESLKATVETLVPVAAPVNAKAPVQVKSKKHAGGRPPSEAQLKIRRRVVAWIAKAEGKYTVRMCATALKLNKIHVMNALRWCEETAGLIKSPGYADQNGKPGRPSKEYFTLPAGRITQEPKAA